LAGEHLFFSRNLKGAALFEWLLSFAILMLACSLLASMASHMQDLASHSLASKAEAASLSKAAIIFQTSMFANSSTTMEGNFSAQGTCLSHFGSPACQRMPVLLYTDRGAIKYDGFWDYVPS
jgi:hypothetical protein